SGSGTGVGAAVAVNVLEDVVTEAVIETGATINVADTLTITATASISPLQIILPIINTGPFVTSLAIAGGAGTGSAAVGASAVVDIFALKTRAAIEDGASVNQTIAAGASQDITISASDDTHLVAGGGGLGISTGGSGVGVGIYVAVIDKDTRAYIGKGANVKAAGDITINAVRVERILAFAATVAAGGDGAGVAGSIIVVVLD